MTTTAAETRIDVEVTNARGVDEFLNAAVNELMPAALRDGRTGILITRTGPGHFTVALSMKVPAGTTWVEDTWQKTSCATMRPDQRDI